MTHEEHFREVGGLLWLAGVPAYEAHNRANQLSRWRLRVAVMVGYLECARLFEASEPAVQEWRARQ